MEKRVIFKGKLLPLLLVAPQLVITAVFFFWPAFEALLQSFQLPDPFGFNTRFVGFKNFIHLFNDSYYLSSIWTTLKFTAWVTGLSLSVALLLAVMTDKIIKGRGFFRTLLIWPYAVAAALAGIIWQFMFIPTIGFIPWYLALFGYQWNHVLNDGEAMLLVVLASAWKQIPYNFLFFLAGLQAIPKSLIEASAIDGAGSWKRFWTIIFPLLTPTTFFLLVVNIVYAFFDTFAVIHSTTMGGPGQATTIMVYKVFSDGFIGQDLGSSAAQSVILMVIVGVLTVIQFRFIEKKVHY